MSLLGNKFDRVRKAAKVALDRTDRLTGNKGNTLGLYEKLTPVHFDAIARVYGQDNLMKYIRQMEYKKLTQHEN